MNKSNLPEPGLKKKMQLEVFRMMKHNRAKQHPLRQIFWECTLRCNLQCRHCGSDCKTTTLTPDMPAEDFLRAIDTITPHIDPHEVMVVISGGEPLLRHDLAKVGKALYDRGYPWGFVTNGWLLDEARLRELLAAGLRSLTISLDGLDELHDWMRGRKGSFERTWRAIQLLTHTEGLAWDIDTCVNRKNIGQLEEIRKVLEKENVRRWRLLTIFPAGRAAEDPDMNITKEEFRQLLDFIRHQRNDYRHGLTTLQCYYGCEGFLGDYEGEVRNNLFDCEAGISVASILIDGSISACTSIRSNYRQGNIYTDDFWEVWENRFKDYRDRKWTRNHEPCSNCNLWKYCEGGGMHQHGENGELIVCRMKGQDLA